MCEYHGQRRLFIAPIIAILLLCLLPSSLLLNTHSGTASAATDSVFYDFITQAPSASWSSAAGNLPFPGSDSDSRGFALYRNNWQLEDNNTWAKVLETHPQWVSDGWIMGRYPQVTVPVNGELRVTVGFLKGATGSDGVTFEVQFEEGQTRQTILSQRATYDGKLDSVTQGLSSIAGKSGHFILYVDAGQNSGQDWAVWAEAKIEIAPPGLPDLVATGVESIPSRIEVGKRICLKPLIDNAGAASSNPCAVRFYVDGEKLVTVDISAIPAGQSLRDVEEVCAYWEPAEVGRHLVSFIADVDEVVDESDEGNNRIKVELEVLAASEDREPPEVTITYSPDNPTDSDHITFNIHAADPSGIGGVTLYVAGTSVTPELTSEAEGEADFAYTAGPYRPGVYHYYVEAWDTLGNPMWTEPEQFRVAYSSPFTLDITISPPEPTSEDIVTFTAVASSPYGVSNIRIFLNLRKIKECSDTTTCSLARGPFREGETVIYSAAAWDGLGTYISLDNRSFTVRVAAKPDLVITDIWNDGDIIKYSIMNAGTMPAGASHTKLLIDGGLEPAAFDPVPALGPGDEIEEEFADFSWSCSPPGDIVVVVADDNDEVAELDELNNVRRERWDCPENPGDTRYLKDVLTMYSEREAFLVSDEDWRNALQLVPLSVWKPPGRARIQAYPLLIYHREGESFDADSTIHFLQQYNPTHLTIFGDTPWALDYLLVASAPGAGLSPARITRQPLTTDAYFSYWWRNYNILVISQDDYEAGMMASVFASYVNAPLLFEGHFDYAVLKDKSVYIVGDLTSTSRQQIERQAYIIEHYSLPQLQAEYVRLTNTDKVILVNSRDFGIYLGEDLTPERGGGVIHCPLKGLSLAAPYLASAREEVIISVNNVALPANPDCNEVPRLTDNFNDVDQFVEDKVTSIFSTTPHYLTIVASPRAIVDSLYRDCYEGWHIRTAVDWKYGSTDNDDPGMKVGRIYGLTISDASAYVARELFYSEIFDNTYAPNEYTGLCIGHSFERYYNNMRKIKGKTTTAGYETRCFVGEDREGCVTATKPSFDNYSERQFIVYGDHGGPWEWSGTMSTMEVPWLDVSYVFAHACLTNDFWEDGGGKNVLGANIIRKGAVCYFGAVGVSCGDNSETKALEHMTGSHRYNIGELNNWLIEHFPVYKRDYMMLGDPLFVPVFKVVDWD